MLKRCIRTPAGRFLYHYPEQGTNVYACPKGKTGTVPSVLAADRLVGTHITSNKPIAVTLGDDSVQKSGAYDYMGDQSIPTVNAQGKTVIGYEYIVMKGKISDLGGGNNEKAYVLTTKPNTKITVTMTQRSHQSPMVPMLPVFS